MRALAIITAAFAVAIVTPTPAAAHNESQLRSMKVERQNHKEVISFFYKKERRWWMALRRNDCWVGLGRKWARLCNVARIEVREARREIARIDRILARHRPKTVLTGPSWLVNAFLCIHKYEGAWNDTGDPYWGGLQMDWDFMSTYGGDLLRAKGPASNWTPAEQIAVAIRAYNSGRGFGPWPHTRLSCGL